MVWICPICGGIDTKPFMRNLELSLRQCMNCSLVFLEPNSGSDNNFEEIEQEFFSEGYVRRRDLFSELFFIHKAKQRLKTIQSFKFSGRLLDIGCGTGELIYVSKQLGYQAEGLEYSNFLAQYVRKKYAATVYCGDAKSMVLTEKYDIVTMCHVLEHALDPVETLKSISNFLNLEGLLYIAVPNLDCWEAKFSGWGSYEPYHRWYFNPNNLKLLLEHAGYKVVDIQTREPYSAWLNTFIRSILSKQHTAARTAVHHDRDGYLRYPFMIGMGALNIARFISGLFSTPFRKIQEVNHKGEELILIASRS